MRRTQALGAVNTFYMLEFEFGHREEGFIFRLRMCVRMESRSDFWSKRPTDLILGMPLEALWEPWRQINCTCNQNPLVFKMITHDEKYFSSLILRYSLTYKVRTPRENEFRG